MLWALPVYGIGLLVPGFTDSRIAIAAVLPIVAIGGGVVMSLPYAILMPLMPEDEHGALTGYYSLSRGLGTLLGPLIAGVCISSFGSAFASTDGYAVMWIVCGVAILASVPLLVLLRRSEQAA